MQYKNGTNVKVGDSVVGSDKNKNAVGGIVVQLFANSAAPGVKSSTVIDDVAVQPSPQSQIVHCNSEDLILLSDLAAKPAVPGTPAPNSPPVPVALAAQPPTP